MKKTGESGWKKAKPVKEKKEKIFDGYLGELNAALFYAYHDVFDPSFCPCLVIGETARQMVDGEKLHLLPYIELGILEKDLAEDPKRYLESILKGDSITRGPRTDWKIGKDLIEFNYKSDEHPEHGVVPVKVKIIKKYQKFFHYPDTVFYDNSEYRIPNSWERYWKIRKLIK